MRKETHWLIFSKDKAENEWEANYLAQRDKTSTWATTVMLALIVLIASIAILAINIHPCQAEFQGSVLGTIDFNMDALPSTAINEAVFNAAEGKIKVSGSCTAIAMFTNR